MQFQVSIHFYFKCRREFRRNVMTEVAKRRRPVGAIRCSYLSCHVSFRLSSHVTKLLDFLTLHIILHLYCEYFMFAQCKVALRFMSLLFTFVLPFLEGSSWVCKGRVGKFIYYQLIKYIVWTDSGSFYQGFVHNFCLYKLNHSCCKHKTFKA